MSTPSFTPGPWKIGERGDLAVYSVGARFIATCGYSNNANPKVLAENKANAALIAAAPELYSACVSVFANWLEHGPEIAPPYIQEVAKAMLKARRVEEE